MPNIEEYQTIFQSEGKLFQLKGYFDGTGGVYWLNVKINPNLNFCGETEFIIGIDSINEVIGQLTEMHRKTKGQSTLKCAGWGSSVTFEISDKLGHLHISGQLNQHWPEQSNHLKFEFNSDQSIIPGLIDVLRTIIADESRK
jgi:hypothetical protein